MYWPRVAGVRIVINPFFFALLLMAALSGLALEMLMIMALLATHEVAHLVVARSYDLVVESLEILPFGSRAVIWGLDTKDAAVESLIAVAGPLNNLLLAGAGWFLSTLDLGSPQLLQHFLEANLTLALFNLLPALPLDGGRILRAHLARRTGFFQATITVSRLGIFLSAILAVIAVGGLLFHVLPPNLFVLALFLYFSALSERREAALGQMMQVWRKSSLLKEKGLLLTRGVVALEHVKLRLVCRELSLDRYHLVWVLDGDLVPVAILTEAEIFSGLLEHGADASLQDLIKQPPGS